ncbi:MAG TPA: sugar kinase [Candidatus Limnocylindria bacterium]|nr:sugar kinase [Candidatus Limnocylindria bacterium]
MKRFVCFGEIMLRLKPPGFERFLQTHLMEATFGGGEANVAVSLANFGLPVSYVTKLPKNDLAEACLRELRGFGVDVSQVARGGSRMGIYFLETGSNQRPSKVIYDRMNSSIAEAKPGDLDWEAILGGAGWLHLTGITPALSQSAADLTLEAASEARRMGLTVSLDLNYRKNLWQYGKKANEVMESVAEQADVLVANEEDFEKSLGIKGERQDADRGHIDPQAYLPVAREAMARFSGVRKVAVTLRRSLSADRNVWQACLYDGVEFLVSREYEITDIVDRVGGGDSFCAGLIYGLNTYESAGDALEFAVAASCLKHTINGDFNRVTVQEAEALMRGSGSGRVQR